MMKKMSPVKKAIIQMLVCSAMWSIAGIFIKLIPWNPFAIAGFRCLIAGATTAVYMAAAKLKLIVDRKSVISGVMLCLTFLAFVTANKMTTAANAIVLQFTAPVFILIFSSVFYGAKLYKNDVIAVVFTLLGIALFFIDKLGPGYLLGNIVGICSGAFMAGMFVSVGNITDPSEKFSGILLGHIFTAIVGVPMLFIIPPESIDARSIVCILILGVVQLGIPYILLGAATRYCPPFACSLLSAVEPLLNPVWVLIFDGEKPGIFALAGAVIVIVSVTVWQTLSIRGSREKETPGP